MLDQLYSPENKLNAAEHDTKLEQSRVINHAMLSWSRDASFFRHFVQQGPELQHLVVMRARARVYAACHRLHLRRGLPDAQQVVRRSVTFSACLASSRPDSG